MTNGVWQRLRHGRNNVIIMVNKGVAVVTIVVELQWLTPPLKFIPVIPPLPPKGPPVPAMLDAASVRPDTILLLDTFFHVVIFHGETIGAWREQGWVYF